VSTIPSDSTRETIKRPNSSIKSDDSASWRGDRPIALDTAKKKEAAWLAVRNEMSTGGVSWATVIWLAVLHLGALAAPFTFSWQGVALAAFMSWLTGSIGICLGFHRLFTHGSFRTSRPMCAIFAFIGGLAGQGSAIFWVANHRKHHAFSDRVGDPHSPKDNAIWSHMLWLVWRRDAKEYRSFTKRWAPDIVIDPVMKFLDRTFIVWHLLLGGIFFAAGYAIGGSYIACSLVVWGMFVRLVFVLHSTWLVNSATHIWGYRNYETTDDSRNNWLVALLTFGEGWHNNHHAYPTMARNGHRWWELDMTYMVIRLLAATGLAWDVIGDRRRRPDRR